MPTRNNNPTADELKLELLRTHIKAGLDALDRGAFTELTTSTSMPCSTD